MLISSVLLLVQIPAGIRDGHTMAAATECSEDRGRPTALCLVPEAGVIVNKHPRRRSGFIGWSVESIDGRARYEMESGAANEWNWSRGDRVKFLIWKSKLVAFESPRDGRWRVHSLEWGHGQWIWKALLVPVLLLLGGAWVSWVRDTFRAGGRWWRNPPDKTEAKARLRQPHHLLTFLSPVVAVCGVGLAVWVYWGGVPPTLVATGAAFATYVVVLVRQRLNKGQQPPAPSQKFAN